MWTRYLLTVSLTMLFIPSANAQQVRLCTSDGRGCITADLEDRIDVAPIPITKNAKPVKAIQLAARVPKKRKGTGGKVFVFNPRTHTWAAYNSRGKLIRSGQASGGKGYCPDVKRRCRTPVGHFRVYSKGSPSCKSSKYPVGKGGAPMPHCMFFYKGYAIHGSPNVPRRNASHGCIRVKPSAAKWLHRNFITHGTRVIVKPY